MNAKKSFVFSLNAHDDAQEKEQKSMLFSNIKRLKKLQ